MALLILGGTGEAKLLAQQLYPAFKKNGSEIIYSIAGLVRNPELPCRVVSGGFSQFGGLLAFIKTNAVTAIIDVTHPFASKMSTTAAQACRQCGLPYWRYQRPQWQATAEDDWQLFNDWKSLLQAVKDKNSLLLTVGQLPKDVLRYFASAGKQKQLLRSAVKPASALPNSMQWMQAIGPFALADEVALMQQYGIDALVSKMSGGAATQAKLIAARQLGIPVYLLARPELKIADKEFSQLAQCTQFLLAQFSVNDKDVGQ